MYTFTTGKHLTGSIARNALRFSRRRGFAVTSSSSTVATSKGIPVASEFEGVTIAKSSADTNQRSKKATVFADFLRKKHEEDMKKKRASAGPDRALAQRNEHVQGVESGSQTLRRPRSRRERGTMPTARHDDTRGATSGRAQRSTRQRNADTTKRKGRSGEDQGVYVKPDPTLEVRTFSTTNFSDAFGKPRRNKAVLRSASPTPDNQISVSSYTAYAPAQEKQKPTAHSAVFNGATLALSRHREVALSNRRKAEKIVQALSSVSRTGNTSNSTTVRST